jgi:ABC-2 type transport system permease protein
MKPGWTAATLAVLRKELRLLFLTPVAWVFLAASLFLGGLFFVVAVTTVGEASLRATLPNVAVVLIFLLPLVTMRQIAEEDRAGTLELVMTAPVPLSALIVGKWLAVLALATAFLAGTLPWVAVLALGGDPDPGPIVTSYLGLVACAGAFAAAGLFASSLTRDPMLAGVLGVLFLLPWWLAGASRDLAPVSLQPALDRLSLVEHLRSFAGGVLDTADVAWFAGFCALFLLFTWRSLESRRWA